MFDRLKTMFGSGSAVRAAQLPNSRNGGFEFAEPYSRQSNGLEQFFHALRDRPALNLLDFAGANQSNISYITSMGHRISSEDFVHALESTFGSELHQNQSNPQLVDQFIQENLAYPIDYFDGALLWDDLQYLNPHLLQITLDRLFDSLRPGSYLLAFFQSDAKARNIPLYHYRITDDRTLSLIPRGSMAHVQHFNNRAIERMFQRYASVKFFLTRDNLREVIVRR